MTILSQLQAANLPVISATEDGQIVMGAMTPDQNDTYNNIILSYFNPTAYADLQAIQVDKQQIKDAYQTMITRLEQIRTTTPSGTTTQILNQIVSAVQDEALYIERIMKVIARLV